MMTAAHPLADRSVLRLADLVGHPVDVCAGNPATTEWADLGVRLLREHGLTPAAPYVPPVGVDETARYLARHGDPMLTTVGGPLIPGAVNVPLAEPEPLSLVSLVHRPDLRHPGLSVLRAAAAELGAREAWLRRPEGCWLPAADAALLAP